MILTELNSLQNSAYTYKTRVRYKSVVDYVTVVTKTMESVNDMITMGNMNMFNNGRYKLFKILYYISTNGANCCAFLALTFIFCSVEMYRVPTASFRSLNARTFGLFMWMRGWHRTSVACPKSMTRQFTARIYLDFTINLTRNSPALSMTGALHSFGLDQGFTLKTTKLVIVIGSWLMLTCKFFSLREL